MAHSRQSNQKKRRSAASERAPATSTRAKDVAFENQAERLARQVVDGGQLLRRLSLLDAPTSHYSVPQSSPRPLPQALREEFEEALGADLAAVRVYTDAPARSAAAAEGARAFTAGSDIYFGAGQWAPTTLQGRCLIAHELVHVLQQTGRAAAGRQWRATRVAGSGPIQRDPQPGASAVSSSSEQPELAPVGILEDVIRLHRAHGQTREFAPRVESLLEVLVDQTSNERQDALDGLIELTAEKTFVQLGISTQSVVYDVLKFCRAFDQAASLLDRNWQLVTIMATDEMLVRLRDTPARAGYILEVLEAHPELSKFWPARIEQSVRDYMFGKTETIEVPMGRVERFGASLQADLQQHTQLRGNERVLFATVRLLELLWFFTDSSSVPGKRSLFESLKDLEAHAAGLFQAPIAQRAWIATHIAQLDPTQIVAGARPGDLLHQAAQMMLRISRHAARILKPLLEYNQDVLSHFRSLGDVELDALTRGDRYEHALVDLPALARSLGATGSPPLVGLMTTLLQRTRQIVETSAVQADDPSRLGPLRAELAAQIHGVVEPIKASLPDLYAALAAREGKVAPQAPVPSRLHQLASLIQLLEMTASRIEGDVQLLAEGDSLSVVSERWLATRIRVLSALQRLGLLTGWQSLAKTALPALNAADVGHSYVALASGWKRDDEPPLDQLASDFSRVDLGGYAMRGEALVALYRADYQARMARELRTIVDQHKQNGVEFDAEFEFPITQAEEAVERNYPRRYEVDDYEYVFRPSDYDAQTGQPLVPLRPLILASPRTQTEFLANRREGEEVLLPESRADHMVGWILPNPTEALQRVARLLDPAAAKRAGEAGLDLLAELVTSRRLFDPRTFLSPGMMRLEWGIAQVAYQARSELDAALREAKNLIRGKLTEVLQAALETGVQSYEHASNRVQGIAYLEQTLIGAGEAVRSFAKSVQPEHDTPVQTAILLLEIAEPLARALDKRTSHAAVVLWAPLVYETLKFLESLPLGSARLTMFIDDSERAASLLGAKGHLEAARDVLAAKIEGDQKAFGMTVIQTRVERAVGDGEETKSVEVDALTRLEHGSQASVVLPEGASFVLDGHHFTIVEIHKSFSFYPGYSAELTELVGTDTGEPILEVDEKVLEGREISSDQPLVTLRIEDAKVTIRAGNMAMLEMLNDLVVRQTRLEQLGQLRETVETTMEVGLDVLEFVPGVGQGVMATRMVVELVRFIAEGGIDDVLEILKEDPIAAITPLLEAVQVDAMDAEMMLDFFLFGGEAPFDLPSPDRDRKGKKQRRRKKGVMGRVSRLSQGVAMFGAKVAVKILELRDRMQVSVHGLRGFVQTHPVISFALRLIVDNFEMIAGAASFLAEGGAGKLFEKGTDTAAGVAQRLVQLVETLRHPDLPDEVIDLSEIVGLVIALFAERAKGAKIKVAYEVLEITGMMDLFSQHIAELLRAKGADPNRVWQAKKDQIEGALGELGKALADSLTEFISESGLPGADALVAGLATSSTQGSGAGEEGQPFGGKLTGAPLPSLRTGGSGQRLPEHLRARAEQRFGHDFSHVRLHQDSFADALTSRVHARALTSGSHIFLSSADTLQRGSGRSEVFDHELAHVLQQTRARPLGGHYSSHASLGRPGRGVNISDTHERAADRAAEQAADTRRRGPVDPGPRLDGGLQPALKISRAWLKKALGELIDTEPYEHLKERSSGIGALGAGPKHPMSKRVWQLLHDAVVRADRRLGLARPLPGDSKVEAKILELLRSRKLFAGKKTDYPKVLGDIEAWAGFDKRVETTGDKQETLIAIDPEVFATVLSAYLFRSEGVRLDFEVRGVSGKHYWSATTKKYTNARGKHRSGGRDEDNLSLAGKVTITHLDVSAFHRGTSSDNIWQHWLEDDTADWKKARKKVDGADSGEIDAETWKTWSDEIRRRFKLQTTLSPWQEDELKFTRKFKEDVIASVIEADKAKDGDTVKNLPRWSKYTEPGEGKATIPALHVKKHAHAKGLGHFDRESHHLTQYLLIEYFRSQNSNQKAFKEGVNYPGLIGDAVEPAGIEAAAGASDDIDFAGLDTGSRADAMPAISLHRDTHKANLHISAVGGWSRMKEEYGVRSQALLVDRWFRSKLERDEAFSALEAGDRTLDEGDEAYAKVHQAIYTAASTTYQKMHKQMLGAKSNLTSNLRDIEMPKYQAWAEQKYPDADERRREGYDAEGDAIAKVVAAAIQKNNDLMGAAGWKV